MLMLHVLTPLVLIHVPATVDSGEMDLLVKV